MKNKKDTRYKIYYVKIPFKTEKTAINVSKELKLKYGYINYILEEYEL